MGKPEKEAKRAIFEALQEVEAVPEVVTVDALASVKNAMRKVLVAVGKSVEFTSAIEI